MSIDLPMLCFFGVKRGAIFLNSLVFEGRPVLITQNRQFTLLLGLVAHSEGTQ